MDLSRRAFFRKAGGVAAGVAAAGVVVATVGLPKPKIVTVRKGIPSPQMKSWKVINKSPTIEDIARQTYGERYMEALVRQINKTNEIFAGIPWKEV